MPILAYTVDLFATAITMFGYALQKRGHMDAEQNKKHVICSAYWWLGMFCLGLTYVLHIGALPFADMVLLASNTAISVVFTQFWAICYLKEQAIWRYDAPACILILIGSFIIVLQANYSEMDYSKDRIMELMFARDAFAYYTLYGLTAITATLIFVKFKRDIGRFKGDFAKYKTIQPSINKEEDSPRMLLEGADANDNSVLDTEASSMELNAHLARENAIKRSDREIVDIIQSSTAMQILEISPKSPIYLKLITKLPILMFSLMYGVSGSLSLCSFKVNGELVRKGQYDFWL